MAGFGKRKGKKKELDSEVVMKGRKKKPVACSLFLHSNQKREKRKGEKESSNLRYNHEKSIETIWLLTEGLGEKEKVQVNREGQPFVFGVWGGKRRETALKRLTNGGKIGNSFLFLQRIREEKKKTAPSKLNQKRTEHVGLRA